MRSSVLLSAAVCAAGVYGTPLDLQNDKRAVETEWTFQTMTETSTTELPPATTWSTVEQGGGPAPVEATTFTLPPTTTLIQGQGQGQAQPTAAQQQQQQQQQQQEEQQQQQQQQQQQAQQQQQQQQPATTQAQPETTTAPAPAPTSSSDDSGNVLDNVLPTAWTSSWSSAWTEGSGNGGGAAPTQSASTMSTAAATTSGAKPTNHYQETLLYNHNIHRSNHSSPSLGWSDKLQASAHKLAAGCVYKHDTSIDGGGYGQNIGYGVGEDEIGQMITNLMYNDEMGFFSALYGIASPLMELFDSWGHFSQIVWKSTTEVGCATVVCDKLGNVDSGSSVPFTVCNYNPPGNSNGEYADNVLQPQGQPIFTV